MKCPICNENEKGGREDLYAHMMIEHTFDENVKFCKDNHLIGNDDYFNYLIEETSFHNDTCPICSHRYRSDGYAKGIADIESHSLKEKKDFCKIHNFSYISNGDVIGFLIKVYALGQK